MADAKTKAPDMTGWSKAGRNISFTTLDGFLFVAVPVDEKTLAASPTSKSGKSKSIGSTEGNVSVPGTAIKLGVNVYTPV